MKELLTQILSNLNCSSSYCQEYEYNINSENFSSWKLYVKEYEMYSALLLYNEVLNKDISEILLDKNSVELMLNDKVFMKLDIITKKNNDSKYSILVPNDDYIESYKNIECMDKKYDKIFDANYIGTYTIQ
jgi:hypothetical protein